jgi:hypothetical protein
MTTVTPSTAATPAFRSVEYFTDQMRTHEHLWTDVRTLGFEYVKVFVTYPDPEGMEAIRNILTAADLIAAERKAADR